jgi:Taurine catabolism dioxygenase TauD, TfdA family
VTGWHNTRNRALPVQSAAQIEATNAVQFIAAANCIRLALKQGEIIFLNNIAIIHGRDAFSEEEEFLKRHFLKMLLRDPAQNWPVPESAEEEWMKLYGPNYADGTRSEGWDIEYRPGGEIKPLNNG